ncbi:monovalent cation/H+ antiporter complex subunit F [Algisphaera agarilytica]|uniref:Multisubunit Na+/H+ antiporter MnhF subunit n=1 Tax=Algisphaera agarilytica TaxID=1385975 RepID=A0A7X0H368_9BACT|nr:monovalent cation/H+ antiporter complex subunit F [Algisphaera agarilytica]MBB6428438.1 multisubunit Na+/H+ antiporter MnhF subunit [Algisphaera agarilytica]
MSFELLTDLFNSYWPAVLAAGQDAAQAAEDDLPERGEMIPFLEFAVITGVYVLCAGMALCLCRLVKGPELADRVLAADLLSLHVVGLVVLLTIYVGNLVFFDAALVVAIIGFVSTLGFAQYIFATAPRTIDPDAPRVPQASDNPPVGDPS